MIGQSRDDVSVCFRYVCITRESQWFNLCCHGEGVMISLCVVIGQLHDDVKVWFEDIRAL